MTGVRLVLEDKVVLITGGSRGIGAECVHLFTQAGARVAFSYRQASAQAEAIVAECGGPSRCIAIQQELSSPSDGRALVQAAIRAFGKLNTLIVNHGIWPPNDVPITQMTEEQWRNTLSTNLDSVFGLVQSAVAQFDRQGTSNLSEEVTGHIVLISSTAGQRGEANHADYAASKGALISLTKSLSSELAPRGIRVNCVAPGWVATEMSAPTLQNPQLGPAIAASIPIGRPATPREIAGPVLFLCTPLAGAISGEVLNVNGGSVLMG